MLLVNTPQSVPSECGGNDGAQDGLPKPLGDLWKGSAPRPTNDLTQIDPADWRPTRNLRYQTRRVGRSAESPGRSPEEGGWC